MALARFVDLRIDAVDPGVLGPFWADTLGRAADTVRIERVAEPVTVKQRVHLDVHVASVDEVLARGASVVSDEFAWTVLRDPEGGELCAFVRDQPPAYRLYEVSVDAADPERIARWWQGVLGGDLVRGDEGEWSLTGPTPFDAFVFAPVPEPKLVRNRVRWGVTGSVDALVAAGAVVLGDGLLADPEGNEFEVTEDTVSVAG